MRAILFLISIVLFTDLSYAQDSLAYLFSTEKIIRSNDLEEGKSIFSADINQDGWQDVIVGTGRRSYTRLYLNDRKGGFLEAVDIDPDNSRSVPLSYLVLDYDDDSDMDIIIGYEWNGVHLYKNKGDQTFESGIEITFDDAVNLALDDIDGDGKPEIISSSGRGSYLRISSIINPDSIKHNWINVGYHYYSELIDMDLDGDKDIVYLDDEDQNFRWLENLGDSISITPRRKQFGTRLSKILVNDFNNDGIDDLILKKDNGFVAYKHVSDTTFLFTRSQNGNGEAIDITIGDFDSDNITDVAYSIENDNLHFIYFSTIDELGKIEIDNNASDLIDLEGADLNNDGLTDILGVSDFHSYAFWFQNFGDGTFSEMKFISKGLYTPTGLSIIDLNNDGKKEILAISGRQSRISYFQMINDSLWKQSNIDTQADNSGNVAVSDFDNDGLYDILYPSFLSGEILWRKNMGNGIFTEPSVVDERYNPRNVYTKDFNSDGLPDVLFSYGSTLYTSLRLVENDKENGFVNQRDFPGASFHYEDEHLLLEDVDGNGFVDVVTRSNIGSQTRVHYNLDGENFEGKAFIYANSINASEPSDFYFEDVDGDGEKDILVIHEKGEVSWMKLLPNGSYSRYLIREAQSGNFLEKNNIVMHDFDADGDNDILLGDHSESKLLFLINLGDGQFKEGKHLIGNVRRDSEFVVADIDDDGDDDIIVLDNYGHELSWFENLSVISSTTSEIPFKKYSVKLIGNYPNPFNPTTNFVFELNRTHEIRFKVFDLTGRVLAEISSKIYNSGRHSLEFDASGLSSGIYFYQMIGEGFTETGKFTLIK